VAPASCAAMRSRGAPFDVALTVKATFWFFRMGVEDQKTWYLQSSSAPESLKSVSP